MKMLFGGDFQSQVYKKGGMLSPHQRYVLEIEGLTGVRKEAIESYIAENKLSDNDVLNIVIGLGRKQLKGSDFSSAVVGVKGNDYSKKIISFAKDNKAMKLEFGGGFQSGVYADGGYFDGSIPDVSSYMTNYAKGGSLEAHGIEIGDTFVKTISGNIQKIKDKNGKIVYVDLSTGERDSQPPLPFDDGGDIDLTDDNVMRVRKPAMPTRKLTNQEIAEKYNASAYEYMETDKKAFGGGLFSRAKMMTKAKKYPDLEDKNVTLKNGKLVKVFSQNENKLKVIEFGKIGSGVAPTTIDISEVETIYKGGGALVGNQKRIDMNKNGKIDAEDFKLLRSSMNGAWRNERKHVNHNEDYEVRYARPRPDRKGYKGKRKFDNGGAIKGYKPYVFYFYYDENEMTFNTLEKALLEAKRLGVMKVRDNLGGEYFVNYANGGGISTAERFKKVVDKNTERNRVKPMSQKMNTGAEVKKGNRGGVMVLAKKIRKDGESWKDALKRAGQQLK